MKNTTYHCPVEITMELIGSKWAVVVLAHVKEAPRRFSELRRLIPDVSEKVLTQRLRSLETSGLLQRTVLSRTPPHVSYDLTDAGRSLAPVLQAMYDWGSSWADEHNIVVEVPAVVTT